MDKPLKVKVIVTEFVETDARHFKSVVQSLTGKDSVVADTAVVKERPKVEVVGGGGLGKGNVVIEIPPSVDEFYDLWAW